MSTTGPALQHEFLLKTKEVRDVTATIDLYDTTELPEPELEALCRQLLTLQSELGDITKRLSRELGIHMVEAADDLVRGGLTTVRTDINGQATVIFDEPFLLAPRSIVVTPVNSIVQIGVLVLSETRVTIWVWDLTGNKWWANMDVNLNWQALLASA